MGDIIKGYIPVPIYFSSMVERQRARQASREMRELLLLIQHFEIRGASDSKGFPRWFHRDFSDIVRGIIAHFLYVGANIKYRYVECRIRKYSPRSLCVKASSRGTRGSISSQHYGRRVSPGRLPRDVMQSSKIFPGSFLVDENGNEHEVYRDLTKLRLGRRKTKIR